MYFIIIDPTDSQNPINLLLDDLIQAHQRQVKVRVILEDSKFKENYSTYQVLTQNGIAIFFDTPQTLLHTKAAVIDKHISIIGSANWSKAALEDNHEISLLVDSQQTAQVILNSISGLELNEEIFLPQGMEGIPVPTAFLLNPDAGYQLLKNSAHQAFNLYLLLLKESHLQQTDTFTIDYAYSLRRLLKTLQDHYRLIKYNPQENRVTLQQKPTSGYFFLPPEYWEYQLPHRLSLRAKYLYLISLYEAAKSTRNPYWFRSQEDLSQLYHLSDYTISLGLQELEKEDIIEISRSLSP
jgi:phosphatidylserine/phosphatidylglycerophosphate/cardiolipin synthase-like enzyme